MKEHIKFTQEKVNKKSGGRETCEIKLSSDEDQIVYNGSFFSEKLTCKGQVRKKTYHELIINKNTGDLFISINTDLNASVEHKKNDFRSIYNLFNKGFGFNKVNIWGRKYKKLTEQFFLCLKRELENHICDDYILNKEYYSLTISPLYLIVVDFHLSKNNIKFHNKVYADICDEYPKKKWLKLNNNKFLPAVLDSYRIKTKYFIGKLSDPDVNVSIKSVVYICRLLGDNYIDHIKKFDWMSACSTNLILKKFHTANNESEINSIISFLNWKDEDGNPELQPIDKLYNIFTLRDYLEARGYFFKLKFRTPDDIDLIIKSCTLFKKQISLGYILKYDIPEPVIEQLESEIIIDGVCFKPKVLLSESDFVMEGIKMKNCMAKQFFHGSIYLYISIASKNERINVQYQKGKLIQSYGKANTPVKEGNFKTALSIMSKRVVKFSGLSWRKEKFKID